MYHGDLIEKLKILYKMHVMPGGCAAVTTELIKVILRYDTFVFDLSEIPNEQEEPDSAFEATQYFFEDITPETSMGKHLTSRDKIYILLKHARRRENNVFTEENLLLHSLIQKI